MLASLGSTVDAWCAKWFSDDVSLEFGSVQLDEISSPFDSNAFDEAIGNLILGHEPGPDNIEADREFFGRVGRQCRGDLIESLNGVFGTQNWSAPISAARDRRAKVFVISSNAFKRVLYICVTRAALVKFRKALIDNPPQLRSVVQWKSVISDLPAHIGAYIGAAKLSLSDLNDLSAGDVIVLTKQTDDALNLTVNGQIVNDKACQFLTDDHGPYIHLKGEDKN